jgi:hypothetical protein
MPAGRRVRNPPPRPPPRQIVQRNFRSAKKTPIPRAPILPCTCIGVTMSASDAQALAAMSLSHDGAAAADSDEDSLGDEDDGALPLPSLFARGAAAHRALDAGGAPQARATHARTSRRVTHHPLPWR